MLGKRQYLFFIFFVLLGSIPSISLIPFLSPWGYDFEYIYSFHTCLFRNDPFLPTNLCKTNLGFSTMGYPPLLYWSFFWVRFFSQEVGVRILAAIIIFGTALSCWPWIKQNCLSRTDRKLGLLFIFLLLPQLPSIFAAERGNNDIVVLITWALGFLLFTRKQFFGSGFFIGMAPLLKIYPLSGEVLLLGILLVRRSEGAAKTLAGVTCATVLTTLVLWDQSLNYFLHFLPGWAAGEKAPWSHVTIYAHSIPALVRLLWIYFSHIAHAFLYGTPLDLAAAKAFVYTGPMMIPGAAVVATAINLSILGAWFLFFFKQKRLDISLLFAATLSYCTYFPGISYDYNLITIYPLLTYLFAKFMSGNQQHLNRIAGALLFGLIAIVGNKHFFDFGYARILPTVLQICWSIALPFILRVDVENEGTEMRYDSL